MMQSMEYYYSNSPIWKEFKADAKFIEEHILELSTDKKVDHARLAVKFKQLFFKENKELKTQNKKLEKEIEELKDER